MNNFNSSKRYFFLSIFSLMISGFLAIIIATSRTPLLNELIQDPEFSKKCLITHVNLSLGVWIHTFIAAFFFILPKKDINKSDTYEIVFFSLSAIGVFLIIISTFLRDSNPILSNYIPTLNNPVFFIGLTMFGFFLMLSYINSNRIFTNIKSNIISNQATFGLKCYSIAFILCMICMLLSYYFTPKNLSIESYYEFLFWGPGHLLQISSQIGLVSMWIILYNQILSNYPISNKIIKTIFIALLLPCIFGLFLPIFGTNNYSSYSSFTLLMKFGIFPPILIFLIIIIPKFLKFKKLTFHSPYFNGLLMSICLTLFGYILGFFISSQNTLIPAHYHASIGGVTVIFMTTSFWISDLFKLKIKNKIKEKKLIKIQPLLFGIGQLIFTIGFSYAGIMGANRKTFGAEQNIRSMGEMTGLIIMGIGGIIAITGGLLFIYIFIIKILNFLFSKHYNC